MIELSILLAMVFGFLKASTDRTLWGSDPKDQYPLWLDDWAWFQRWKKQKVSLPLIPWLPIDAWHFLDAIKYTVGFFGGVCFYVGMGSLEWYWWIAVAVAGFLVMSTTKWLFYEILFWKKPMDGFRNWKTKW